MRHCNASHATALFADKAQQIRQHVFKTLKVHHGMVVLHSRDGVVHGRIMRADLKGGFDLNQIKQLMPIWCSTKPYTVQHLLYLNLIHTDKARG